MKYTESKAKVPFDSERDDDAFGADGRDDECLMDNVATASSARRAISSRKPKKRRATLFFMPNDRRIGT